MSHCITIAVMRAMLVKTEHSISFLAFQSPAYLLLYLIKWIGKSKVLIVPHHEAESLALHHYCGHRYSLSLLAFQLPASKVMEK